MAYHAVWGLWFGIDHKALFHHSYYHTRMGAVAWAVVYSLLETLFIMHDLNLIQKSYFFLLLAAGDIVVATCVLTMGCNTARDGGEFWSSNMLELGSVVYVSSQYVRGVVVSSGLPILLSITFIRFAQDGVKKELVVWVVACVFECFVEDLVYLYTSLLVLLMVVFIYVYRHTIIVLLAAPLLAVPVLLYALYKAAMFGWVEALRQTETDVKGVYNKVFSCFSSRPQRKDFGPVNPSVLY